MSTKEFQQELQLEACQEQQELNFIQSEYGTPSWSFLDEEDHKGFYTNYHGKSLKDHKQDMIGLGFNY